MGSSLLLVLDICLHPKPLIMGLHISLGAGKLSGSVSQGQGKRCPHQKVCYGGLEIPHGVGLLSGGPVGEYDVPKKPVNIQSFILIEGI